MFDVELDQAGLRFSESFAAARKGRRIVVSSILPAFHAVTIVGHGGKLGSWTAVLEGSLDGVNWTTLVTASGTEGATVWDTDGAAKPVRYIRANVSALTLGDASYAVVVGVSKA